MSNKEAPFLAQFPLPDSLVQAEALLLLYGADVPTTKIDSLLPYTRLEKTDALPLIAAGIPPEAISVK